MSCHCVVDWLKPVEGASALSWWHVHVEERRDWLNGPAPRRKTYTVQAIDDNEAAAQGLRRFEDEFSGPAIVLN